MPRSKKLMSTNVGSMKLGENGTMQIEVFPQRLLNIGTAQKLLNELNTIEGIIRMVVYGPGLPRDDPDDLLEGKFGVAEKKYFNIMGEMVELSVQVGRIWIEIEDTKAIEKIREACEKALPFPFELNEGLYLRRKKTVSDYARRGPNVDDMSLGMFDPKVKREPACCGLDHTDKNERV
ncbi:methyl-coenzyme M reductase operon protein D [Methanocella paludicola]|nr:methyl-coenzyme M reductase operon protein D [Methanocella paludicola]